MAIWVHTSFWDFGWALLPFEHYDLANLMNYPPRFGRNILRRNPVSSTAFKSPAVAPLAGETCE